MILPLLYYNSSMIRGKSYSLSKKEILLLFPVIDCILHLQDRSKVKSRSYHHVAHLHHLTNVFDKYQLSTPYSFQSIAWRRFERSRSQWRGQRSNQGHTIILHSHTPNHCPNEVSTSYNLWFPRYCPDKMFKLKVTKARSKVKSRLHHTY